MYNIGTAVEYISGGIYKLKKSLSCFRPDFESLPYLDDMAYVLLFGRNAGLRMYEMHAEACFESCIFCKYLSRSECHKYCHSCRRGAYTDCGMLLPGMLPYMACGSDIDAGSDTPWIWRMPCPLFTRREGNRYFGAFYSFDLSRTAACYEVLEGIFFGISRGRKPCNTCVSIDPAAFRACRKEDMERENEPCRRFLVSVLMQFDRRAT